MATVYIDNQPFEVNPENNLLHECLSLGFDLPYFCWHPALHSVGACRQCAVSEYKDAEDRKGRIVMACMTPAKDGTRIGVHDEQSTAFRKSIIEWLMLNHPHDCPVCEEGGECHLQDMTLMTGHCFRRTRFPKRTYYNQNLGPCLTHEMNRCIQCYRCVRFYKYAGGKDLEAFHIHDNVYFGRQTDGTLESEFSGNLAEVCPTGVFTDKTLSERYTRKWDLRATPSICRHCSLGCNISPGERYGEVRRIVNRYNHDVNGYFICDRGRYGYQFANSPARIRRSRLEGRPVEHDEALAQFASFTSQPERLIGIGSPRASLEANFALRTLVGAQRFSHGMARAEAALVGRALEVQSACAAHIPALREAEQADAVLVLGEDVSNTAPRLALALRQTTRQKSYAVARQIGVDYWHDASVRDIGVHFQSPLLVATPAATRLDDAASETWRLAPAEIARLGFAVAHALNERAPQVPDLDADMREAAERIAAGLRGSSCPLVVAGTGCGEPALIEAAANIANALVSAGRVQAMLSLVVPECNSAGASLLGGLNLEEAFAALERGDADTLVILENDLFRRADSGEARRALEKAARVIVVDCLDNDTTSAGALVLAAGSFAEDDGTLVNNEGRAQRFFRLFEPEADIRAGWEWLRDALRANGRTEAAAWDHLGQVTRACSEALPIFAGIEAAAVSADYRVAGMKAVREPHRYSGRTAKVANREIHEPTPLHDPDSALSYTMEGYQGAVPGSIQAFFWAPGWNSNQQSITKFQDEVAGILKAGESGCRLLGARSERSADGTSSTAPMPGGEPSFHGAPPAAFTPRDGEWLGVPLYHVFGSEELSSHSPALAERAPPAHLAMNAADAARLGVEAGAMVEIRVAASGTRVSSGSGAGPAGGYERVGNDPSGTQDSPRHKSAGGATGSQYRLPLRIAPELPPGVVGVLGVPPLVARLPAAVHLEGAAR